MPTAAPPLPHPLAPATRIPAGQRCTQRLRTFFLGEIAPQFELNRFVHRWHRENPDGSGVEALDAWRTHRDAPVDAREA